jgi:putative oxidoreductase
MNTQSIYRIGVVLYALVIAFFGVNHFLNRTGFQNTIPAIIPYHVFWVYLTGIALIAAAISFLTGKYTKAAGLFLALFLLIRSEGDPIVSISLTNLVKDTGLAGAALMIAGSKSN